jgi:hypothetical protein
VAGKYVKEMADPQTTSEKSSEQRTEAAIEVLRQHAAATAAQVPKITDESTGVIITQARALVRLSYSSTPGTPRTP